MKKMLHTKAVVLKKSVQKTEGILDAVVGSSEVLDRMGDSINQSGWKLNAYKKTNPVILWGHNVKEERPPIGKALKTWIKEKGEKTAKLMFKVQFDLQDPFASEIFRKVKDGFINTVSVGFKPLEWELFEENNPFSGRKYLKQELLELSFVPVPANPEAIVALKGMKDARFDPVKLEDLYPAKKDEAKEKKEKIVINDEASSIISDGTDSDTTVSLEIEDSKEVKKVKKVKKVKEVEEGGEEEEEKDEGEPLADIKPYENEHACRLRSPGDFKEGSFRRTKRKHDGKEYSIIMGRLKGKTTMTEQSYRYNKGTWDAASARSHCKSHDGSFEAATGKKEEVEKEAKSKKVLPYKDLDTLPESAPWDGPGEVAKAEVSDLKLMCTWHDNEKADAKSSYKLPHHMAEGHKAVWRGVASAMASLLGARGGVDIPEGDRKGVFNHLEKHYEDFNKDVPEFKAVEEQVLKGYDEEIHALILDREDKYMIRLVKRVLKGQKQAKKKEVKKTVKKGYTSGQVKSALEVIDLALSQALKGSAKGGEEKG